MDEVTEKQSAMETKIENIETSRNRYPFGWKFVGRGMSQTREDIVHKHPLTFTECVDLCEKKRASDGASWNGIEYCPAIQDCYCNKNDGGHDSRTSRSHIVHLRFE